MKRNKSNNYIQRAILCVAFVAVLMGLLYLSARRVERKDSEEKNGTFFTEAAAGHIDGLFLGSSHVVNGINPAQIYEESGYTVYNLAGHGSILPVSYWTLVNALDYCTPQIVFIDTYMIEKDYQYLDINVEGDHHDTAAAVDQLHEVFDCFPDTANKRAAIADLISDEETRREFSLDFIKYHGRWSELDENDYRETLRREHTSHMGAQLRYEVSGKVYDCPLIAPDQMDETDSIGKQYLHRIIELCLSKGIRPVIVQVPFAADEDYQLAANSAQRIADEYGIPFVNLQYVDHIINEYSDLQSQTHLSAYGSYKVSHYLAQNTLQELGMTDHRGDPGYEAWESSVDGWHQEILRLAKDRDDDLYAALMILQFEDLTSKVYIRPDSLLLQDAFFAKEIADLQNNVPGCEIHMDYAGAEGLSDYDYGADVQIYVYNRADGNLIARHDWTDSKIVVE